MKTGSEKRANKYAKALLESIRPTALRAAVEELALLAEVFSNQDNKTVIAVLANPVVAHTKKQEIVDAALEGKVSAPVKNLCLLLIERGAFQLLPLVAAQFEKLVNEFEKASELFITSAKSFSDAEQNSLRESIKKNLGNLGELVQFNFATDPSLLGGMLVRSGDKLLDSSVRGVVNRIFDSLEKADV